MRASPHLSRPGNAGNGWTVIRQYLPYLLAFKGRVLLAMACLVLAKVANVFVPVVMKHIVNDMSRLPVVFTVPVALLIAYGALRLSSTVLAELRDAVFAKATQRSVRHIALQTFRHLHALPLRFHLEKQTGGVSRDIERGTRGLEVVMRFMLFNILPTIVEIVLVAVLLVVRYDYRFFVIIALTIACYIAFTLGFTEWRMRFRYAMNAAESQANSRSVDSLLNYETVKYFSNEAFEAKRYEENLERWEKAAVKSSLSLSALNAGQSAIVAVGVTLLMYVAAQGVVQHTMSIGDLVMVNAFMIQLYTPLNNLGFVYREVKHGLADAEKMFGLLDIEGEIKDRPGAPALQLKHGHVQFNAVDFAYEANRQILHGVDFEILPGQTVAAVGHSGAGKSTLSRLLFRFYDVNGGHVSIDGQDIRDVTQASLRRNIGVVPQDTVLFNDTIYYNILYGRPDATREEVMAAAKAAHIHNFIESLPDSYDTQVGERGLKLSGGEKQRVAIARTILKNPPILIFDEATSALDSASEKAIQEELERIARGKTTLIIAHRLSTIVDADQILVMDQGRVVERGTHAELLAAAGAYARMWALQQSEKEADGDEDEGRGAQPTEMRA